MNGIVDSYLEDLDLAKIALSFHFALDLLLQGGSFRLYTMNHWAPLSMKFLVRIAPLPSAGKWFTKFAVFRKLVLPSHTLFSSIEVAGHIVVILGDFLKSLFTHRQLLNFLFLVFIYCSGHAVPCNLLNP